MIVQWNTLAEVLKSMLYRWEPPFSPARSALVALTRLELSAWWIVGSAALCATAIALFLPGLAWVAFIGLLWAGLALLHALYGLAGERYMLITEPLLFILIGVVLGRLPLFRPVWKPTGLTKSRIEAE
jgi:hypothetical protein